MSTAAQLSKAKRFAGVNVALKRTDDALSEPELRNLLDFEPDQEVPAAIQVCAGEWRQEGNVWRFFIDPNWEE